MSAFVKVSAINFVHNPPVHTYCSTCRIIPELAHFTFANSRVYGTSAHAKRGRRRQYASLFDCVRVQRIAAVIREELDKESDHPTGSRWTGTEIFEKAAARSRKQDFEKHDGNVFYHSFVALHKGRQELAQHGCVVKHTRLRTVRIQGIPGQNPNETRRG